VAPFYGLMWWLNTDRRQFKAASERSYFALGWGSHIVWIDPDNDLVTVLRSAPVAMGGYNVEFPKLFVPAPKLDGYVVGMEARLVDTRGKVVTIRDVMLHHIVFHRKRHADIRGACTNRNAEPFYGTGEENQSLILPTGWTGELVKPCPVAPFYGLMWWLNTNKRQFAAASERSYFALGWGSHIVWIDPDNELVTVLRWIDRKQAPGFVERLLGALAK